MAFCQNCGAPVEGSFCAKCGAAMPAADAGGASASAAASGFTPGYAPMQPVAPVAAAGMAENTASALCYLLGLITGIIFLVLAPYNQNRNIRFHAFQSIFFHIGLIIIWMGLFIVGFALPGVLHLLLLPIDLLLWFGGFLLWLYLMWKADNNQRVVLPIVGPRAEKQAYSGNV